MSRLLEIFRREKKILWQQLCKELEADFVPGKGFFQKDAIKAYHGNWTIIIDTYKRGKRPTITRIRAPYVNRDSFQFRIFRKRVDSGINKLLGMQDLEVGYKEFDDEFIIQGNDQRKLKMLFSHQRIREIISLQPEIYLESETDQSWLHNPLGEGISELKFQVKGIITNLDRLHDLYDLFADLLNHLCHIGSAYEDDPKLSA
ncbi:MAG: DUF3137 domain-containing protein [Bacteroidota bacterium]